MLLIPKRIYKLRLKRLKTNNKMKLSYVKLILLFAFSFFILACPMPHQFSGELEVVKTDGVQTESKRFENDTAVIKLDNAEIQLKGNWNSNLSPGLLIDIIVSNNSKEDLILKFSEINLKTANGENGVIGDIGKPKQNGTYTYLREAREDGKENTDLPKDFVLPPNSTDTFHIGFLTSESIEEDGGESLYYFSVPIEFENMADSKKDLQVTFKAVGNK